MEYRKSCSSASSEPSLPRSPTPPPSSSSSSSSSESPSPPRYRRVWSSLSSLPPLPTSPKTLAEEFCALPLVSYVCEMVSAVHAKLCRVVPFFDIVSAWFTSAAAVVVRRFSHYALVSIIMAPVEWAVMWVLDIVRNKDQLRPEKLAQKMLLRVRKNVVRASTKVASHPLTRLTLRVTLIVTGKICRFFEVLKFDGENQSGMGEVFIIGSLLQLYNRTITGLTGRLRTGYSALQDLLEPQDDRIKDLDSCDKKRKRHDDNDGGQQASDSSSDDDSAEDGVNEHTNAEDGTAEETKGLPPVTIKVTSYD